MENYLLKQQNCQRHELTVGKNFSGALFSEIKSARFQSISSSLRTTEVLEVISAWRHQGLFVCRFKGL